MKPCARELTDNVCSNVAVFSGHLSKSCQWSHLDPNWSCHRGSNFFTDLPLWVLGLARSRIHASQTQTLHPTWDSFCFGQTFCCILDFSFKLFYNYFLDILFGCAIKVAGLGGSVGCAVQLETRRSLVQPPPSWATFFWRLIMKYFLRSFSPFRWFEKGSCQFLAKECAQYWLTA